MVVSHVVSQESTCEGLAFRKFKITFFFLDRETDCYINFISYPTYSSSFLLSIAILLMFLRMDNTSKIIIIPFS